MRCQSHPDVETSSQCTGCGIPWCQSCVKVVVGKRTCPSCGHQVITVDAEALSLGGTFKDIAVRLISIGGIFVAFGIGALSLLGEHSNLFALLHLAALAGYYFVLIRHVGEGQARLPGSADSDLDWSDIFGYALRGIMVGVASFLPLIAYLILANTWKVDEIIGMILLGQLYMPAVVLAVLLSGSWLGALWPVAWFKIIAVSPGRYLRFTGIWFATAIAGGLLGSMLQDSLPSNLLGLWISMSLSAWLAFAQAIVVGHYVRENRTAFGWTEAASITRTAVPPDPLPVATMRAHSSSRAHAPSGLTVVPVAAAPAQPRRSRMPSSIPFDVPPEEAIPAEAAPPPPPPPAAPRSVNVIEIDRRPRSSGILIGNLMQSDPDALRATVEAAAPRRAQVRYSAQRMALSTEGIDATREDGSRCVVAWPAVAGVVARRMPGEEAEGGFVFVDVVSSPGSTLRLVPWTTLAGVELPGTPTDRARVFIRLVRRYAENARLDGRTQAFVDGTEPPLQLPDAAILAEHDRRLA